MPLGSKKVFFAYIPPATATKIYPTSRDAAAIASLQSKNKITVPPPSQYCQAIYLYRTASIHKIRMHFFLPQQTSFNTKLQTSFNTKLQTSFNTKLQTSEYAIRKSASIRQVERKWNRTARFYNRLPSLKTARLPLSFSYRIFRRLSFPCTDTGIHFITMTKSSRFLRRSPKCCKERMVAWRERKRRLNRFAYELVVFFPP